MNRRASCVPLRDGLGQYYVTFQRIRPGQGQLEDRRICLRKNHTGHCRLVQYSMVFLSTYA